jgi:hypothetical protein
MSINQNKIKIKEFVTPASKKRMNSWEKQFITGLYKQKNKWSSRQEELFQEIVVKYQLSSKPVINKIQIAPDATVFETNKIKVKNLDKVTKLTDAYVDKNEIIKYRNKFK